MPNGLELIGQKFGMLTVVSMIRTKSGRSWFCKCDCGKMKTKPVSGYELKAGIRKTCGCGNKSMYSRVTHGKSNSKLYKVWSSMKRRCSNQKDQAFSNYGGRGISVCKEWMTFEPFQEWAMASGYSTGLTIERRNNNGNYCPENCTWIPKSAQSSNTRKCVLLTYKGRTMNMKEWADEIGVSYHLLQGRKQRGWDDEKTITTPSVQPCFAHGKTIKFCGITKSGCGWARELGISKSAFHRRMKKYGSIDEVVRNSDAELFKRMVQEATGIPVSVEG